MTEKDKCLRGYWTRYPVCKYEILRIAKQFEDVFETKPASDNLTGKPKSTLIYYDDGFSISLQYNGRCSGNNREIIERIIEEYKSRFPRVETHHCKEVNSKGYGSPITRYYDVLQVYYNSIDEYVKEKLKGV